MKLQNILRNEYDPENDLGRVTYTDAALLEVVIDLAEKVTELQDKVKHLEKCRQKRPSSHARELVARRWLLDYLATNGVSKPADIMVSAEKESISKSMVYRSRRSLRYLIRDTHGRQDPANCWELAEIPPSDKKGLSDHE